MYSLTQPRAKCWFIRPTSEVTPVPLIHSQRLLVSAISILTLDVAVLLGLFSLYRQLYLQIDRGGK